MINNDMREYSFYTYGATDAYGQQQLSKEPTGTVKIAINITSQSVQDNINYRGASYLGLTYSNLLDDSAVIEYCDKKLKVLYVNPKGRLKQVFLAEL